MITALPPLLTKRGILFTPDRRREALDAKSLDPPLAMSTNWQRIWAHVTHEFLCDRQSVHGPAHWRRVELNGLLVATRSGAIEPVVQLFAVSYDARHEHEAWDDTHGSREAAYASVVTRYGLRLLPEL